ncbi:dihydrofolate reductase [Paenibacillus hodogayensis]|uniref:Dihydrofolate reductase n=1 Tax=Paenibacillus hodogayensis TaxID=279208 RepID=A0ABV5VT05_9BACL
MSAGTRAGIAMIAAMDRNRVIGKAKGIPWRLPEEQQYFRAVTMGHAVLSGRVNFEAMKRPLPGRSNIILTRDPEYAADGCEVVHSVGEALERHAANNGSPLFVIGGEQIYRLFLPYADTLYLTEIDAEFEGDTWFPALNRAEWQEVSRKPALADPQTPYHYEYVVYRLRPSD